MEVETTPRDENIVDELNDLIALDYDAVAAYDAAISRLDDTEIQRMLTEFRQDHRRHITELSSVVSSLGGKPRDHGDIKVVLTKGKVLLASLRGDRQILEAMKSNEDQTNRMYEKAVEACRMAPPMVVDVLERGLSDERRHRGWILERLAMY